MENSSVSDGAMIERGLGSYWIFGAVCWSMAGNSMPPGSAIDADAPVDPKFIEQILLEPVLSHHSPGSPADLKADYRIPDQTGLLDESFNIG
jgi:hypothetical protein